jgi:hypothetical protein
MPPPSGVVSTHRRFHRRLGSEPGVLVLSLSGSAFSLTRDEESMVETIRDYARGELLPLDRQWDIDETSVHVILPQLAEMGLLNIVVPEELGGLGCSYRTYAAILHEISYASPSVAVTIAVHNMVGKILGKQAREPLRGEWVNRWGTPDSFAAFALTEAEAGSDAAGAKTAALRADGGFRVTGEKMWITNGLSCRWFLTLVRLAGAPEGEDLCALLIDGREPGISRAKITGKLGIRGSETAVIHFEDVFVPETHLVGAVGDGLKVFLTTLNEGRIGIGTQATGIAEACLDEMISYARQRQQFGRPIGRLQAVADMISDSAVELYASMALIGRAAALVDQGSVERIASSMAKRYATDAANRIAYRAIQVHGGTGYVRECRVEQLYRDVRVTTIYEGTNEIQKLLIARELARIGV